MRVIPGRGEFNEPNAYNPYIPPHCTETSMEVAFYWPKYFGQVCQINYSFRDSSGTTWNGQFVGCQNP